MSEEAPADKIYLLFLKPSKTAIEPFFLYLPLIFWGKSAVSAPFSAKNCGNAHGDKAGNGGGMKNFS